MVSRSSIIMASRLCLLFKLFLRIVSILCGDMRSLSLVVSECDLPLSFVFVAGMLVQFVFRIWMMHWSVVWGSLFESVQPLQGCNGDSSPIMVKCLSVECTLFLFFSF